ncbi:phosphoenolpyruvate carboxykinase [Prochlorococcus sp. AH-736-D21]|nr:phosphoenolpyruvate carboxykinase [Prochlorococcus sp. AH-736-D21]
MSHNFFKVVGIKDESREDSDLFYLNQVEGLKDILDRDFAEWSNFDGWESIAVQQWIFNRALDLYRGKKIDIKCDCCEYIDSLPSDFGNIKKENCYGKKSAYMIKKVLEEIVLAKTKRDADGTYLV